MTHFVIIGLGSNVGNREAHLRQAIELLRPHMEALKESPVYASSAMLPDNAPKDWDIPFLNMAICGQTGLSPTALLAAIRDVEKDIGRNRTAHWGPREIDVDILAYDQQVIDDEQLRVPHPGLLERAFVLMPVQDIVPHWKYPRPSLHQGRTMNDLARELLSGSQNCALHLATLPERAS